MPILSFHRNFYRKVSSKDKRKKMVLGIFRKIGEGVKQSMLSVREIREAKKLEKQRMCRVIYIEKNSMVYDYIGKLSPNSDFLTIENLNRLFFVDRIYYSKKVIPTVFVSTMYHRTIPIETLASLDLTFLKEGIAKAPKGEISKVKAFKTLNMNEFDSQKSFDFSNDAFTIMKSKAFEFLEDVAKRTIYFVFLIGLLLGMFLGSVIVAWIK